MDRPERLGTIEQTGRVLAGPDQYTYLVLRCTTRPTLSRPVASVDPVSEVTTGLVLVARFATQVARRLAADATPVPRLEVDAVLSLARERSGYWALIDATIEVHAALPGAPDALPLLQAADRVARDRAAWGADASAIVRVHADTAMEETPVEASAPPARRPSLLARLRPRAPPDFRRGC